ncbi:hypothetical protein CL644_00885 [bacterium]|nr:hypothetical protein [bacterium]|tara:strand:+ start:254 stop:484 length:231 start_codon:yes stop_codon:yes gene_type:complete
MIDIFGGNTLLVVTLSLLWTLPWTAWALWLAARRGEKVWFVVLLVLNTLALLEIFYIFAIAKRSDTKELENEDAFT